METMIMNNSETPKSTSESGMEWLSISDLMTGLMVIFLFIAISYMINIRSKNQQMSQIAETYENLHSDLIYDLTEEFKNDLPRWSAHIDSASIAIRFTEPDVLFEPEKDSIRPKFAAILDDFFPRYIKILTSDKYRGDIAEQGLKGIPRVNGWDYPGIWRILPIWNYHRHGRVPFLNT